MNSDIAKGILDKIVGQVFGYQNPLTLEQFAQKYAFDVRLPSLVYDSTTNEPTWAASTNPAKFMTLTNTRKREFEVPKRPLNDIQSILAAWNEVNYTATERQIESINVFESDCVYNSENVYRSTDAIRSKNVLFSEAALDCEFVAGIQRTNFSTFCVRVEDSQHCSNSFSVSWSNKITNSLFIDDCFDMTDCMFCSHMSGKQYCIANMQYTKEEYEKIRDQVVRWILAS